MIKTVFFDLDGTLTDSADGIIASLKYALDKYGIEEKDESVLRKFLGPPISDKACEIYGVSKNDGDLIVEYYREFFVEKGMFINKVYDGVPQMLDKLKKLGKKIVLATSKPEIHAIEILKKFEIYKYFDLSVGATLDGSLNKKDEVIAHAIKRANALKMSSIMVGDTYYDVLGGRANGLKTVAVTYGYNSALELKKALPDYTVDTVTELEKLLMEI